MTTKIEVHPELLTQAVRNSLFFLRQSAIDQEVDNGAVMSSVADIGNQLFHVREILSHSHSLFSHSSLDDHMNEIIKCCSRLYYNEVCSFDEAVRIAQLYAEGVNGHNHTPASIPSTLRISVQNIDDRDSIQLLSPIIRAALEHFKPEVFTFPKSANKLSGALFDLQMSNSPWSNAASGLDREPAILKGVEWLNTLVKERIISPAEAIAITSGLGTNDFKSKAVDTVVTMTQEIMSRTGKRLIVDTILHSMILDYPVSIDFMELKTLIKSDDYLSIPLSIVSKMVMSPADHAFKNEIQENIRSIHHGIHTFSTDTRDEDMKDNDQFLWG